MLGPSNGKIVVECLRKKYSTKPRKSQSLDMGARNQYSSINFLGGFIEGISIVNFCVRFLHCCFWLREKLVEYPRLLVISPRSLNNFWNFPQCAKCKSPLHDRTCKRSANYSARTFSCYRAKPKCNFAVCPLYDRSAMLGRLLQTVWVCFLEKKRKRNIVWEFAKMFETMVGVELLEGYKRAVCDTCRYTIFW